MFKKLIFLIRNYKIISKNIKVVNLEILKVKTWFCDKDLSSVSLLNKTHDFIKDDKFT